MTITDTVEHILSDSRRSLFAEQIVEEAIRKHSIYITSEQVNAVVAQEPERFDYQSNGSIMLHYEKVFLSIANRLRDINRDWSRYQNDNVALILFIIRLIGHPELISKLGFQPEKYTGMSFEEAAKDLIQDLVRHSELPVDQLYNFNKQELRFSWKDLAGFESDIRSIPDFYFGIYFSNLFRSGDRYHNQYLEPNSTCAELIASLASTLPGNHVLDPFAGIGSFIIEFDKQRDFTKKKSYWLADININAAVYGKINLFLNGIDEFVYINTDSFLEPSIVSPDLIITNPPFFHSSDQRDVVELVLNQLADEGQALIIVPDGYLFHSKNKRQRKMLIESGQIRSIISLPSSLFMPFVTVKTSILHLVKTCTQSQPVLFIKTDDLTIENLREKIPSLTQVFSDRMAQEGISKLVSVEEILNNDTNLSVPLYFTVSFRDYGNNELGQLLKPVKKGVSYRTVGKDLLNEERIGLPVIRTSSLPNSSEAIYLNIANTKSYSSQLPGVRLPNKTLLLSLVGPTLRPTLVDTTQELILDGRSVIALQADSEKVLPEYLAYHLNDEPILEQVRSYYQGLTSQYIRKEDLYKIRVKIPDLDAQRLYVDEKQRILGKSLNQIREEISYERFSTLQHSMSQPLRNLRGDFDTLLAYLQEKSEEQSAISFLDYTAPVFEDETPEELDKTRLISVTNRLNTSIKYLQNSLRKVDALIKTSEPLESSPVQIRELLERVLDMNNNNTYSYRTKGPDVTVQADQFLLDAAFSYLIENAVKHGFDFRQDSERNQIVAEISVRRFQNVEIMLMNNGRPMADGIGSEQIFEKGRTSHKRSGSGFGGFVINEIIKKHQGTIELISRPSDAYPVQFRITLPI
ncbi:N-6 DNA methylase [Larkinella sp. C7]|uniref:N-6 DNA methylase n=1 Tax=Larkinella sp. C7 TaxID=2576607 RepID=UPI0011110102|nr:N-6 DNA methylase [Larkinella sp. C7]